jgi:hypothetical protein
MLICNPCANVYTSPATNFYNSPTTTVPLPLLSQVCRNTPPLQSHRQTTHSVRPHRLGPHTPSRSRTRTRIRSQLRKNHRSQYHHHNPPQWSLLLLSWSRPPHRSQVPRRSHLQPPSASALIENHPRALTSSRGTSSTQQRFGKCEPREKDRARAVQFEILYNKFAS